MSLIIRNRLSLAVAAILLLERVGRIVMDFGFGAFLEKFEENFGRTATRGLLLLIGLAVAITMVSLIFSSIRPITSFLLNLISNIVDVNTLALIFFLFGSSLSLVVFCIYAVISHQFIRAYYKRKIAELRLLLDKAEEICKRSQDFNSASRLLLEDVIHEGMTSGALSQEKVDLIQSLLSTESETPP